MKNKNNYDYLLSDLTKLNGVGKKTMETLKKKKVNNIFDLLWRLPKSYTDRTLVSKICDLQIGAIQTIRIVPLKYQFPRVRNLPNKVNCLDETGKIDCIFFNSHEGYVRKILPLNEDVTVSGKIGNYKGRYQITNPTYISQESSLIETVNNKYSLTEGITEKTYNKIINQILKNLPILTEWHDKEILKKFNNESWNEAIVKLHDPKNIENYKSDFYKRLAYDEILASFLVNSEIRKKIKRIKKESKKFTKKAHNNIINKLNFNLTNDQTRSLEDINKDLNSKSKMFRLLQGDVGSGKTIVALISSLSVISSGFQVALMAPTEILARQHYTLAKKLFPKDINIELLSSKSENNEKKRIVTQLEGNEIHMVFGTHAIFQKKIIFANLGYIIIDEQHKFGVRQRK
ncbi:DEAD/DEAH box helicase, partial [Candidatus Pelagibacter sp.]|nr:DEAD/DEAH box helicase [Candidatus Pelagibacter sp.]